MRAGALTEFICSGVSGGGRDCAGKAGVGAGAGAAGMGGAERMEAKLAADIPEGFRATGGGAGKPLGVVPDRSGRLFSLSGPACRLAAFR